MTLNDTLANMFSKVLSYEKVAKKEVVIKPVSKVIEKILEIMNQNQYIGTYETIKDSKGNLIRINLLGNINKCGVIKPRYYVKMKDFEKFEKRYLPSKDFGIIFVSTSKGLLTHIEAKEKNVGGKIIGYCY